MIRTDGDYQVFDRKIGSEMRDRALFRDINFFKAWRKHNKLYSDIFLLKELL